MAERLVLAFAAALALLIGVLAYNTWIAFRSSSAEADLARQVIEQTNALLSSLKDAETGQRGFLLTGEDRYLEPYRLALTEIPPGLDALERIETQHSAVPQLQRIGALRPLVKDKLDELTQTIDLRRNQGPDAAIAAVRTGRGQTIMDQIRMICAEIDAATNALAVQEREGRRTSANETALLGIFGGAAIFMVLVFATITIERGTRRRQQLIEALQVSEDQIRQSRDWFRTTLASIGDAVVTTDETGKITFLNAVAQSLTGWNNEDAAGKPLEQVFVIRNEGTGREVENPVTTVLREGRVVGLANHTKLVAKDGRNIPIDDSAAPIS